MAQTVQWDRIREISTGIAVTGIFILLSVTLPVIGFISYMLIPLPIIFYRLKLGRKNGMIIIVVSAVMIAAATQGLTLDFFLFTGLLVMGGLLSEFIELDLPIDKTIFFSTLILMAAGFTGLIFYSQMSGQTVFSMITDYIGKNLELTIALYREIGVADENIEVLANSAPKIKEVIVRVLPAFAMSTFFFIAWINLLVSKAVLNRKGLTLFNRHAPINHWRAPDHLVWGVIGSALLLLVPEKTFRFIGLNGLIVFMAIYFYQGIAIVSFFLEKKKLPRPVRVLIYFIVFQQIVLLAVIMTGFFDSWANFRKIGITEENQDENE